MRNYQFARHLARRHQVSLITYQRHPSPDSRLALARFCESIWSVDTPFPTSRQKRWAQLRSLGSRSSYLHWLFWSPLMQTTIDKALGDHCFDLIQVEGSVMASFTFPTDAPLILDEHNIEYELLDRTYRTERSPLRKAYNWAEYLKFRREELEAWARFDGCVLTSEREAATLRRMAPQLPSAVVENGVDLDYFSPDTGLTDPMSIVFTGRMNYRPNADAVKYFVRDVFPAVLRKHPAVRLTIVGTDVPDEVRRLAAPQVLLTGWVPDVRPYLATAAVVIAPLRMGGGTRLKILEALAMGKGVVSTSVGCEGLAVESGKHLLVADNPQTFAAEVTRVMEDRWLAAELGGAGRRLVERRYGWETVSDSLEDFHTGLRSRYSARRASEGFSNG